MEIIEVKQNWKDDLIRIDLTIGNYCNYKCWYCWPGSNEGNLRFPDFDMFTKNLSHLLDHYIKTTNKRKFDFHIMGGEVTHWPKFFDLIKFCKERYDCIFTLTTNGSKKLSFWEEAAPYLDYVSISTHHEFCDPVHVRNVADLLYEKNVIVNSIVLMDPFHWDKCMGIIEQLKQSKRKWSIRYLEIIHDTVSYTEEQKKILKTTRARTPNLWWFFKNNKSYRSKVKVTDSAGKKHNVSDGEIILRRLNQFKGWQCSLGVNWIAIKADGTVSGICSSGLFKNHEKYNILDPDFVEKFNPVIEYTVCNLEHCWCPFESNMDKRKVIPINAV